MRAVSLRRALFVSAAAIAVAALGACETNKGTYQAPPASAFDQAIKTEVDQLLAQSGARAANALETLAQIQRVRSEPVAAPIDESGLPPELQRKTEVEWSGPANALVRELAASIGYSYLETGNPPPVPPMVQVEIRGVTAAKAFETVGLQIQKFATIILDPNQRRVELRHESAVAPLPTPAPTKAPAKTKSSGKATKVTN